MARFYKIRIGTTYVSEDGTNTDSKLCKLQVTGADALRQTLTGSVTPACDGTPIVQTFDYTQGKPLEIRVDAIPKTVLDTLITAINTALESDSTIQVSGVGDAGDFTKNCIPQLPNPYSFGEFINGRMKNVTFRFITTN